MNTTPLCPLCKFQSVFYFKKRDLICFRCQQCGLHFRHPQPDPGQLIRLYNKDYYEPWMHDSSWESLESQKRATFSSYLERLVVFKKTGRLLDVGCAFGALLRLATENGFEPYGIDVNPFAVDIAKRTIPNVYCTTIEDVPFPDQYFDVVVMTDTIEHIVNCSSTLSVANRKLAPGGVLLITTPDTGSLSRFLLGKHWPHYKMEHIYYFNRRNMKILLNTFDVLDIRRSHKQVSFRYFANVLRRYSTNPFFHKCYAPAHALSKVFGDMTFDIPMGEMLVIAKRKN